MQEDKESMPVTEIREMFRLSRKMADLMADLNEDLLTEIVQLKAEIADLQTENEQLRAKIKSALNKRIAELLARRKRTVDSGIGELKRGFADEDEQPDTAAIFKAADSLIQKTISNREAVRAATADTDSIIRQSEAAITSAAAHRAERDAERKRLAAERLMDDKERLLDDKERLLDDNKK